MTGVAPSTINPISIAYDSSKGEIFASNSVISDSTNTVVAQVLQDIASKQELGDVAYDSGKGEIIEATLTGLSVFSDSSSPSTSTGTTASATVSPSPTVPEFSSVALVSVVAAMIALSVTAVALKSRTRKTLRENIDETAIKENPKISLFFFVLFTTEFRDKPARLISSLG